MNSYQLLNIASKSLMNLASQYLNFKCGEEEFKNPFMNGLQMMAMSFAAQDLFKDNHFNLSDVVLEPLLFGASTVVDDFLISRGWTSKHYLTDITSAFSIYNTIDNNANDIKNFMNFQLTRDMFILSRLIESKNLVQIKESLTQEKERLKALNNNDNNYIKENSLYISIGLLGVKYLQEYYTGSKGYIEATRDLQIQVTRNIKDIEYVTGCTGNIKKAIVFQAVNNELIKSLSGFFSWSELDYIGNIISTLFVREIYCSVGARGVNARNNQIINSPEALLKISSIDTHSNTLHEIDKISDDINTCSRKILELNAILNSISTMPRGFAALNLRSTFGEVLKFKDEIEIQQKIDAITAQMSKSKSSLVSNPRTAIERSSLEYYCDFNKNNQETLTHLQEVLEEKNHKKNLTSILGIFDGLIPAIINRDINLFLSSLALCSGVRDSIKIERTLIPLKRLVDLYKFVESAKNTSYVSYKSHDGNYLKLKDLTVDINGLNKLTVEDFTLESGKWYLLTGKSGCGKTTFMSALRGLPNFTPDIEIKGSIYYPKLSSSEGPKIYMLTQSNNFPYGVSLLENICYPMVTTEYERQSYKTLIEELMLKMEGFARNSIEGREYLEFGLLSRLDERINDITSETSGGQQKKMSITGLTVRIMKETGMLKFYSEAISLGLSHDDAMAQAKYSVGPVLVLIDETFNGLDSGANGGTFEYSSKGLVLKTLKESLPASAIVVSVEHQPQFDQYDGRIHLNGDGTYIYSGSRATEVVPEETEDFEPLEVISS